MEDQLATYIYQTFLNVEAYIAATNEKQLLQEHIAHEVDAGTFPIATRDAGSGRLLDVGCGNGVHTSYLARLFPHCGVIGIDRSNDGIERARTTGREANAKYVCATLHAFHSGAEYDFILMSHVLQYTGDEPSNAFVGRAVALLRPGGELWIVQQTRQGMAEIIAHMRPFLDPEVFSAWRTFEDFREELSPMFATLGDAVAVSETLLPTAFRQIDFVSPSDSDKQRLAFMLGLHEPYDAQSMEFKTHLSRFQLGHDGWISHPNGILRIRKCPDRSF